MPITTLPLERHGVRWPPVSGCLQSEPMACRTILPFACIQASEQCRVPSPTVSPDTSTIANKTAASPVAVFLGPGCPCGTTQGYGNGAVATREIFESTSAKVQMAPVATNTPTLMRWLRQHR